MELSYLLWLSLFAAIAYMVAVDKNVAEFINLFFMGVGIQLRKYYYMVILHPRNPITNWIMERKMKKLAKEMCEQLGILETDETDD